MNTNEGPNLSRGPDTHGQGRASEQIYATTPQVRKEAAPSALSTEAMKEIQLREKLTFLEGNLTKLDPNDPSNAELINATNRAIEKVTNDLLLIDPYKKANPN